MLPLQRHTELFHCPENPLPCSWHVSHLKAFPSTHSLLLHYFVFLECPMMMGLARCGGLPICFPLSLITNLCKHLCATFLHGHGFQQTYPRETPGSCGQTGFSYGRNCGAAFRPFFIPGAPAAPPSFVTVRFLDVSHSEGCATVPAVASVCGSLVTHDVSHLLLHTFAICHSS